MSKIKHGHMLCLTPDCGTVVVVKRNIVTNTLSWTCAECDGYGYAKQGSGQYAAWEKRITPLPAPAASPAAAPAAAPAAGGNGTAAPEKKAAPALVKRPVTLLG